MPAEGNFKVLVRDTDFTTLGAVAYNRLEVHPRFNAVGSWSLSCAAGSAAAELLAAGRGVQIFRANNLDVPVLTGPVGAISEGTADGSASSSALVFGGPCDNIALTNRLAYPVPANALSAQSAAYDVRSGDAETVMKAYVNANAGPGALVARRTLSLTIEANTHRGAAVAYSARWDNLLTLLQNLGVSGGLGFKVQQVGGGLVFSVYVPTDRSGLVRFAAASGSLGTYSYSLTAPTGTTAIVGDAGSGTGRAFTSVTDSTAESDWLTRAEIFVDSSSTTDATQLAQAGQQALDSGSPQAQVAFTPIDTSQRAYGIDYGLGDLVTVDLAATTIVDVVREVAIIDDPAQGVSSSPIVGGSQATDPSTTPAIYRTLRNVGVALGLLQRRR